MIIGFNSHHRKNRSNDQVIPNARCAGDDSTWSRSLTPVKRRVTHLGPRDQSSYDPKRSRLYFIKAATEFSLRPQNLKAPTDNAAETSLLTLNLNANPVPASTPSFGSLFGASSRANHPEI